MKIALATTTIHVPHALKLLRKCSADIGIFVAIEDRAADKIYETVKAKEVMGHVVVRGTNPPNGWKCSEALGWNTIARRNIAFLEALKRGADVIYSWDDDNIPDVGVSGDFFDAFSTLLSADSFFGFKVSGEWFDPGQLLIPTTRHRGFPHARRPSVHASSVVDARIGVVAGLVIGNPDIDATTRMELRPDIGAVHILGSAGVVVDPGTWTVFNSQNTAVIRELIPAWFMMPGVGRHDDIYASLIVQRVARERGLHVHFGKPFCHQQRNEHDLLTDLKAEIAGMEHVEHLAGILDHIVLAGQDVIADTAAIYKTLAAVEWIPKQAVEAAFLWLEDCRGVM